MNMPHTSLVFPPSSPPFTDPVPALEERAKTHAPQKVRAIRITPCIPQPAYLPSLFDKAVDWLTTKVTPVNPKQLLMKGSLEEVQTWVNSGGDLKLQDEENNFIPHILAIGRDDQADYTVTKQVARAVFQHYSRETMRQMCAAHNHRGQTPWDEIVTNCERGSSQFLNNGCLAMAEELLSAGASPLQANNPKCLNDYPAVGLLPFLSNMTCLLRVMTTMDRTLCLQPFPQVEGFPSRHQVFNNCPNLLCAAIHKPAPKALDNLLKQGALVIEEESPVYPVLCNLHMLHINPELLACAQVLSSHYVKLPGSVIPESLLSGLQTWEDILSNTRPGPPQTDADRNRDRNRKQNVIQAFQCFLNLIPDPSAALATYPSTPDSAQSTMLRNGLLVVLEKQYPELYKTAQTMPDLQPFLNLRGHKSSH